MDNVKLVHQLTCAFEGREYLIEVFSRPDGSHYARTMFSPQDVIISDGFSFEEALVRHQALLPLAIRSRKMPRSSRLTN
jgi:hypothetical protein